MAELKPCPFCGGDPMVGLRFTDIMQLGKGYDVHCLRCGARTALYPNAHDAMKEWNKRVGEQDAEKPV